MATKRTRISQSKLLTLSPNWLCADTEPNLQEKSNASNPYHMK